MRMRKMKNLEPRMEKCAALRVQEPTGRLGHWRELMPECTDLWVEVGCGKGKFTAETAQANPTVLLIAVERCREAMVVAMEKAQAMGLTNAKRRLTHRGFLDKYCRVVCPGGEIHFKTDNAPLFAFSLEEFAACGLETKAVTDDLHKDGVVGIMTGYEEKFHGLGTPIHRCEVVCKPFVLPKEEKAEAQEA